MSSDHFLPFITYLSGAMLINLLLGRKCYRKLCYLVSSDHFLPFITYLSGAMLINLLLGKKCYSKTVLPGEQRSFPPLHHLPVRGHAHQPPPRQEML